MCAFVVGSRSVTAHPQFCRQSSHFLDMSFQGTSTSTSRTKDGFDKRGHKRPLASGRDGLRCSLPQSARGCKEGPAVARSLHSEGMGKKPRRPKHPCWSCVAGPLGDESRPSQNEVRFQGCCRQCHTARSCECGAFARGCELPWCTLCQKRVAIWCLDCSPDGYNLDTQYCLDCLSAAGRDLVRELQPGRSALNSERSLEGMGCKARSHEDVRYGYDEWDGTDHRILKCVVCHGGQRDVKTESMISLSSDQTLRVWNWRSGTLQAILRDGDPCFRVDAVCHIVGTTVVLSATRIYGRAHTRAKSEIMACESDSDGIVDVFPRHRYGTEVIVWNWHEKKSRARHYLTHLFGHTPRLPEPVSQANSANDKRRWLKFVNPAIRTMLIMELVSETTFRWVYAADRLVLHEGTLSTAAKTNAFTQRLGSSCCFNMFRASNASLFCEHIAWLPNLSFIAVGLNGSAGGGCVNVYHWVEGCVVLHARASWDRLVSDWVLNTSLLGLSSSADGTAIYIAAPVTEERSQEGRPEHNHNFADHCASNHILRRNRMGDTPKALDELAELFDVPRSVRAAGYQKIGQERHIDDSTCNH